MADAPHHLPYWRNQPTEDLAKGIQAYFDTKASVPNAVAPTPAQITLIKNYIVKWANYPQWKVKDEDIDKLTALRTAAAAIGSTDNIDDWLVDSLKLGIDPF